MSPHSTAHVLAPLHIARANHDNYLQKGMFLSSFLAFLFFIATAAAASPQVLRGHVPPAAARLTPLHRLANTNFLRLSIGLPLRNQASLSNLVQQVSDPASPNYRRYIKPAEFAQQFGPAEADYNKVVAFAKANGLEVVRTHPNRMLVDVRGSVDKVEKAFAVKMQVYKHPKENRTFYAPDNEPTLDLPAPVLDVSGLNNYFRPRPRLQKPAAVAQRLGSGPEGSYMGNDFRAAYVPGCPLTGLGQTVGLLQFDGYNPVDIRYYEDQARLPHVTLTNVLLDGFDGNPTKGYGSGETEVCLDIQTVISMAPGISKIIVYEDDPYNGNWHTILNYMANDTNAAGLPAANQLSCSWYSPGAPADPVADQIFMQMAAQGQSFFEASGDYDAFTGDMDFPSDTPYITEVGGTTLSTSGPEASWESETAWNWGYDIGIGTGGGISTYYPIPSWQTNLSMSANQGSTTMRNTPDVALTADNVYVRSDWTDRIVGGTSAAAPLWAALTALANQQAAALGIPPVGFANPVLYEIGVNNPSCFHDIVTGNNRSANSPEKFDAVTGYDLCTGWGTPAGQSLIDALAPGAEFAPPIILAQPQSQIVTAGHTADFTVPVIGATPLSYQWKRNGVAISGATSSSFRVNNATLADAASYSVVLSNAYGSVLSDPAVLTVTPATSIAGSAGVVSWWKAENNCDDAMGLNAGLLEGDATYSAGLVGQYGFSFSGAGHVRVPASSSLDVGVVPAGAQGGAFTLEAWVNPSGPGAVFAWTNSTTETYTKLAIREAGALFGGLSFGPGTCNHTSRNAVITWNCYQHIAIVFDDSTRSGHMKLYVNGLPVYEASSEHDTSLVLGTQGDLHLGDAFTGENLVGRIDEPAIYNRALSSNEIWAIYQSGAAGRSASPTIPSIATQPQSQTILKGHCATFTVVAAGTDTNSLSYQWRCNGMNIPGATQTSFTAANAMSTASYSVVVANRAGGVPSADAILTVTEPTCISALDGLVSWWPGENNAADVMGANLAYLYNTNVTFVPGFINQAFHFRSGWGEDEFAALWIPNSTNLNVGQNGHFTAAAWVKMDEIGPEDIPFAPVFEWSQGVTFQILERGRLHAFVGLTPDLWGLACTSADGVIAWGTYQHLAMTVDYNSAQSNVWLRLYINGTEVASSMESGLDFEVAVQTFGDLLLGQNCNGVIDEPCIYNRCLSASEILDLYNASVAGRCPRPPLSVAIEPASQTVVQGQYAVFTAMLGGFPTYPLTFQWQHNGTLIPGATDSAYSPGNTPLAAAGTYSVTVSNVAGWVASSAATLAVNSAVLTNVPNGLVSFWQGEGDASDTMELNPGAVEGGVNYESGFVGQCFTFDGTGQVRVTNSPTLNVGVGSAFTIEGWVKSSNDGYILSWPGDSGSQGVAVMAAEHRIEGWIGFSPGNQWIWFQGWNPMPSQYQHFAVTCSEIENGTMVQVFVNGVLADEQIAYHASETWHAQTSGDLSIGPDFTGQIDELAIYNRALSTEEIAGIYQASLAGRSSPPPSILSQPQSQTAIVGANASFCVTAAGPSLGYQWRFNGSDVTGATASCFTLNNVQPSNAGTYSVVVTNAAGTASASATLTVGTPPSLSLGAARVTEQVINFETITDYNNDHVLFHKPTYSTSTSAFIDSKKANTTMVVTSFPSGNTNGDGSKVLRTDWTFKAGTSNPWLRLDTYNMTRIPNPAFNFLGRIRFDIYSTRSIKLALGLRETDSNVAVGADGGTFGTIEWIGVTNMSGTAPNCTRIISPGAWTTVEFDLTTEPCWGFAGDGYLDGAQGVLEHLAIVPNGGLTNYTVYLDNFQMITTPTLPGDEVFMRNNSTLTFTASATDPGAGEVLTYSLDAGAPSGASINASSGVFTWTPTAGGTLNSITIRVTDNGYPSLSDAKTIAVRVATDPLGVQSEKTALADAGQPAKLSWQAVPGASYQVQYKQADGEWTNLGGPIVAGDAEAVVEIPSADQDIFYRILDLSGSVSDQ